MSEPKVIDLRTRSAYQPDCASLARNRLTLARHSLGLSHEEFAEMLTPLVGWPVTPQAVESWETTLVPPGDILIAAASVTPTGVDHLGVRSHKFIAAHYGQARVDAGASVSWPDSRPTSIPHPTGNCHLHLWPFGVAIYHLVENLELPNLAHLATWRYRTYEENLAWATDHIRGLTGTPKATASYVLSLYWLHTSTWTGRMLDTAMRIICTPRVLVQRDIDDEGCLSTAEHAERTLLAEGYDHEEMRSFGIRGVSIGYASWSGVAYHPVDPARSLAEDELVSLELKLQAIWAYCEHINTQIEEGREPVVPDGYGWRFLRGVRSRLVNPRSQETGQHRSMREAILETSGLLGHLDQAIEALREIER